MARYGQTQAVGQLFQGLFDAASYMDMRRLPELFCGFPRQPGRGPTLYPVACSPQAWASAAPFSLLEASLGLEFDLPSHEIRLRNPVLPDFMSEVLIRNLRLGAASADIAVRRHDESISLHILRTTGQVQISLCFRPDQAAP
jgi:glycogen debranching enzyme